MLIYIIKIEYRARRWLYRKLCRYLSTIYAKYLFFVNNATFGKCFESNGIPTVDINKGCRLAIGQTFKMNNGLNFNRIGRQQPCFFIADLGGIITIGDNVGMSSTAIICHKQVSIGNNVRIGGNTVIYDTDFHSIDFNKRTVMPENKSDIRSEAVFIKDNVFIGAHSTILKGVTIGQNSIIGAGSVVTKNVPDNQIWAGNPAKFIKSLNLQGNFESQLLVKIH